MADFISEALTASYNALISLNNSLVSILPSVFAGIILLIIGYALGWIAKKIIIFILESGHFDDFLSQQRLTEKIWNKSITQLTGSIVKWYVFFIFLKQAAELINLITLTEVLGFWINFALLLIGAFVVVIAGIVIARYVRNIVEMTRSPLRKTIGLIVELSIVYVAIVMGVRLIGLPTGILEAAFLIAFGGFVLASSIVIGLSFGFALKDEAKGIVKEIKKMK